MVVIPQVGGIVRGEDVLLDFRLNDLFLVELASPGYIIQELHIPGMKNNKNEKYDSMRHYIFYCFSMVWQYKGIALQ